MASSRYLKAREKFGNGDIDWVNDTIHATLVDTSQYVVDLSSDEYLDSIPDDAIVSTVQLTGKSNADGVLDADPVVFPNVDAGANIGAIVLWKDTGFVNSSPLIAYIDNAPELPVIGDGTDITVTWDDGTNKVMQI